MTKSQNAPQEKWPPCIVQLTNNLQRCRILIQARRAISLMARLVIEGVWIRSQRIGDRLCRHGMVSVTGQPSTFTPHIWCLDGERVAAV